MFLSMTGFGSNSCEFSWGTVIFEISSVNSKYQDFATKFPRELASLETKMMNLMRNSIGRGRVRLYAEIAWNSAAQIPQINEEGFINLYNQIKNIAENNNINFSGNIADLLKIPGVFDANANNDLVEKAALENPEIWDKIVSDAIKSMLEMKKIEGEKLRAKVEDDLNILEKIIKSMEERWKTAKSDALESIRTRIENILEHYNLEIDEARIAAEVSLAADKWDISEEIARLESHIEKFRITMNLPESPGKKLDFLIQEMNREVNTMGAKVADAEFRWQIVESKTCIERMREQLQNIE